MTLPFIDYYEIFKKFNELKIDYFVVGGIAVNLHGVPRMTYDIDIMVKLNKKNLSKFIDQLLKWGYKLKIPVKPLELLNIKKLKRWIKEKNMKTINFYNEKEPLAEIGIVLASPIPYEKLKLNSIYVKLGDEKIPVIGLRDLIYIKSKTGRRQDKADVESLKKLLKHNE